MAYMPSGSRHHVVRKKKTPGTPGTSAASQHHVVKPKKMLVKTNSAGDIIAIAPKNKQTKSARLPGKPTKSRGRKVTTVIRKAVSNYVVTAMLPTHHVVKSKSAAVVKPAPVPTPKSALAKVKARMRSVFGGIRKRLGF